MKKILVTGATGFIGNYVIAELLKRNLIVIASSSEIEKAKAATWFSMVKYIPFNLKEFNHSINYYQFFDKPDAMIHLAWEGLPNYKSAFHVEENLPRHYSFLKNCILHGMTDITVTGTCFEYGMIEGCLTEKMDTRPANAYAIAKDTLRKQLQILQGTKGFSFKWVRLFYMFGAGQSPNSLLSQLDKALIQKEAVFNMSGGEQERDYLSVEKVAENIVKIALQNKVTGIINCCSGVPIKVKEFVQDFLLATKQHIQLNLGYYPYADYEPMRFWGDDTKLKTIK
ncbi:MAG: NAD(P)-dependent oxidoreductase [Ferruginibacter sp.]|nr:NAD(P)-dependent oxidoreductase [Ferruginibacter sp.]